MNNRLFLWMLIVTLAFTACEGKVGPPGRNGRDGIDGESTQWFIQDFEIKSEHWRPVTDDLIGNIFEYGFNFSKLTGFVFDAGAVVCHLVQSVNNQVNYTPLPYTFYGEAGGEFYSENYTYEVRPGYINFIVKVSDFATDVQQPLPCTFRVVLMW